MATSSDGLYLAVGFDSGELMLWTTTNFSNPALLRFHDASISCVSFSPDSRLLSSACQDAIIVIWDTASQYPLHTESIDEQGYATQVSFTEDGHGVAYLVNQEGSKDDDSINGMRRLCWYFQNAPSLNDQPAPEDVPSSCVILHGAHLAFVDVSDDSVTFWNWTSGDSDSPRFPKGNVTAMTFSYSGALLAVACPDVGVVQLFNAAHYWTAELGFVYPQVTHVLQVVMSLDGSQVAYLVQDDEATTVHVESLLPIDNGLRKSLDHQIHIYL
jgi:WD40 repeat protein